MGKKVSDLACIGSKMLRVCVLQQKNVKCSGVCRGAFVSESSGKTEVIMCSAYENAFDLGINCGDKAMHSRLRDGTVVRC